MVDKNKLRGKLDRLKNKIRKNTFPELKGVSIGVYLKNSDEEFMAYGTYDEEDCIGDYYIDIDRSILQAPRTALVGCIGHELAHIYVDQQMKPFWRLFEEHVLRKKPTYRIWDERRTDLIAVERGLGKELIEFERFATPIRKRRDEINGEEGLNEEEITKLMSGELKRNDILNGCFRNWMYAALTY